MRKLTKAQTSLAVGAGLLALMAGIGVSTVQFGGNNWFSRQTKPQLQTNPQTASGDSTLVPLMALSPLQRVVQLTEIAQGPASLDRNRARYLLATDLMQQQQGAKALVWLQGLEEDYAVLAPHVALKQAQIYESLGDQAKARAAWQALLQRYPQHSVTAEALFQLGNTEPDYWDRVITEFPAHPRSSEIARLRLRQNPNQPQLLLLLAKHAFYAPGIIPVLDRLVRQYPLQLSPQDWQAIAFAYWENQEYGKAGLAYALAPSTPRNLYRTGRGLQLGGKPLDASAAYQRLEQTFPTAPETATGLIRQAKLVEQPQAALTALDQVVKQFPDRAAEALLVKADVLEQMKSSKLATQTRQKILTQYRSSDAAAELRWQQAQRRATAKDYQAAWTWAHPITVHNSKSEIAPEAAFWVGKWAQQLGRQQDAKESFEYVLSHYPDSYYAWRSAVYLGLNVGDFTTVRQRLPQVTRAIDRPALPVGSPTLKELYQLGQNQDAWTLWQVEFQNPQEPTVTEQFTDGLMRLGVGDHLDGLFMLSSLDQRTLPQEKAEYASLKQQTDYWRALYPFPFLEPITAWSQQRQLNPLLVTALIRQESRFEPAIRSSVGAAGLMQVMPETAAWIAQQIKLKGYQLDRPEDNIKLGTWYLDYTHAEYDNNSLFAVASYNAGPGNVADWIARFGFRDPDTFVEAIPFDETKGYVKSVFGNYWNYLRLYNPEVSQLVAKYAPPRLLASRKHGSEMHYKPKIGLQ